MAQPVDDGGAVVGRQHVVEGVAGGRAAGAVGHGQQVQVVVAQQAGGGVAQVLEPAQGGQRGRPPVGQVAQQEEPVARRREVDVGEQPLEGVAAPLQVADQVVHGGIVPWGHGGASPGSATLDAFFVSCAPGHRRARPAWTSLYLFS